MLLATVRPAVTIDIADRGCAVQIDVGPTPLEGSICRVHQDVDKRITALLLHPSVECRRALPGLILANDTITVVVPWLTPVTVGRNPLPEP